MVVFGQKWCVFVQSVCIWNKLVVFAKMVVFGQNCLYSGKSGCIPTKWLYSG